MDLLSAIGITEDNCNMFINFLNRRKEEINELMEREIAWGMDTTKTESEYLKYCEKLQEVYEFKRTHCSEGNYITES